MQTFKPQQVPPSSWKEWVREGVALARQRWQLNALVAAGVGAAFELAKGVPLVSVAGLFAPPLVLALFVVIARSADVSVDPAREVQARGPGFACVAGLTLYWMALFVIVMALLALAFKVSHRAAGDTASVLGSTQTFNDAVQRAAAEHSPSVLDWGRGALLVLAIWMAGGRAVLATTVAVMVAPGVRRAMDAADEALEANRFIKRQSLAAGFIGMAGTVLAGPLVLVLYPLAGCVLYVAFRHIYMAVPPRRSAVALPAAARTAAPKA